MSDFIDPPLPADPPLPFEVKRHLRMYACIAGKAGDTVLTIEQQIFNTRINEYEDGVSIFRHWCYADAGEALVALARYMGDDEATEPTGWTKMVEAGKGVRRNGEAEWRLD